jgi:hypothetical protein
MYYNMTNKFTYRTKVKLINKIKSFIIADFIQLIL